MNGQASRHGTIRRDSPGGYSANRAAKRRRKNEPKEKQEVIFE